MITTCNVKIHCRYPQSSSFDWGEAKFIIVFHGSPFLSMTYQICRSKRHQGDILQGVSIALRAAALCERPFLLQFATAKQLELVGFEPRDSSSETNDARPRVGR